MIGDGRHVFRVAFVFFCEWRSSVAKELALLSECGCERRSGYERNNERMHLQFYLPPGILILCHVTKDRDDSIPSDNIMPIGLTSITLLHHIKFDC